jgi:hypothetical protein
MANNIEIDVTAKENASQEIGKIGEASKNVSKVVVNSMGTSEEAFDTAARGTGKLGDALDKTEGATGKLGEGVSGVSDAISSFNDLSNHGANRQRELARAQIDVKQAANDAKQALEDYNQAQRDGAQAGIDAQQAQLDEKQSLQDLANAQKQYNADVKQYGANSSQAKQDLIDISQAQIDNKQAVEDGKQAQRDANQANIDSTQAMIDQKSAAVDLNEAQSNLASQNSTLGKVSSVLDMFGGILSGVSAAIGLVTVAQWAWNAAQLASPTTWIILAIVALVAVIVLVATKTKFFQTIWEAVWGFMKEVGAWFAGPFKDAMIAVWHALEKAVKFVVDVYIAEWKAVWALLKTIGSWFAGPFANFFKAAWRVITSAFTSAKNSMVSGIQSIIAKGVSFINFFISLPSKIGSRLYNTFSPLWAGFKAAINNIIRGWNSLRFSVPGFDFMGVHVGGFSLGVPRLPYLAVGGDVLKGGLAYIHQGERLTDAATTQRLDRTQQTEKMTHAEPREIRILIGLEFDDARTGDKLMDGVLDGIRGYVKSAGGGNVQVALGRGRAS